jgi:hypothetical protein
MVYLVNSRAGQDCIGKLELLVANHVISNLRPIAKACPYRSADFSGVYDNTATMMLAVTSLFAE